MLQLTQSYYDSKLFVSKINPKQITEFLYAYFNESNKCALLYTMPEHIVKGGLSQISLTRTGNVAIDTKLLLLTCILLV